jgi:hypothetical protein
MLAPKVLGKDCAHIQTKLCAPIPVCVHTQAAAQQVKRKVKTSLCML